MTGWMPPARYVALASGGGGASSVRSMVRVIRRALLAVGVAGMIAGVLRLRGRGGVPPQRGGWQEVPFTDRP